MHNILSHRSKLKVPVVLATVVTTVCAKIALPQAWSAGDASPTGRSR